MTAPGGPTRLCAWRAVAVFSDGSLPSYVANATSSVTPAAANAIAPSCDNRRRIKFCTAGDARRLFCAATAILIAPIWQPRGQSEVY